MKKLLAIAAVSLAATSVFASKARVTALGDAAHLDDVQGIFSNPATATVLGDLATFEFGTGAYSYTAGTANTASGVSGHEGGFLRSSGDSIYGLYLGKKSDDQTLFRTISNALTTNDVLFQENPIELIYGMKGDIGFVGSLSYAAADKKSSKQKSNTAGIRFGAKATTWDAYLNLGLVGTAKNDTTSGSETDFKSSATYKLGGSYTLDTLYIYGLYGASGAKTTVGSTDTMELEYSEYNLGVVNSHKKEGNEFFYGVSYWNKTLKNKTGAGTKGEFTTLPVVIGVEAEAASWLVLRASVTQNVLLGSVQDDTATALLLASATATTEKDTLNDSTTVAAGAGLKFNKFLLDGTLSAAQNGGRLSTGTGASDDLSLLAKASLNYMF